MKTVSRRKTKWTAPLLCALGAAIALPAAAASDLTLQIGGYQYGADENNADAMAMDSFNAACQALRKAGRASAKVISIDCGNPENVADDGFVQYQADAAIRVSVTARVYSSNEITGAEYLAQDTASSSDADARRQAQASYESKCRSFLAGSRSRYGSRLVLAECGAPQNISSSYGYQFASQGLVILGPRAAPPNPPGPPSPPPAPPSCIPDPAVETYQSQLQACQQSQSQAQDILSQLEANRQGLLAKIGHIGDTQNAIGQCRASILSTSQQAAQADHDAAQLEGQAQQLRQQLADLSAQLARIQKPPIGYTCYALDNKYFNGGIVSDASQQVALSKAIAQCPDCRSHGAVEGCEPYYN